ncbi:hypothetical protein WR25_11540 isoform C [Diploscapter pachys]|nr:hypothetical protein WR25_11540 isoform C [Diploscapter pachys]
MDFDPHGAKWQCCCCNLPTGMKFLAAFEFVVCTAIASVTMHHVITQNTAASYFEVFLIATMILMAFTSLLMAIGITINRVTLLYPSLVARGALIVFIEAFSVWAVFNQDESQTTATTSILKKKKSGKWEIETKKSTPPPADSIEQTHTALVLVLLVFATLFITVFCFYCIYLVVR